MQRGREKDVVKAIAYMGVVEREKEREREREKYIEGERTLL